MAPTTSLLPRGTRGSKSSPTSSLPRLGIDAPHFLTSRATSSVCIPPAYLLVGSHRGSPPGSGSVRRPLPDLLPGEGRGADRTCVVAERPGDDRRGRAAGPHPPVELQPGRLPEQPSPRRPAPPHPHEGRGERRHQAPPAPPPPPPRP